MKPTDSTNPFATHGDIGAAVIDLDSELVLGLVFATMENYTEPSTNTVYKNVVFCLRLNYALHFLFENLSIQLGRFRTF